MDKIWDRNPAKSEVIGRCGRDERKKKLQRRTDTVKTLCLCTKFFDKGRHGVVGCTSDA